VSIRLPHRRPCQFLQLLHTWEPWRVRVHHQLGSQDLRSAGSGLRCRRGGPGGPGASCRGPGDAEVARGDGWGGSDCNGVCCGFYAAPGNPRSVLDGE